MVLVRFWFLIERKTRYPFLMYLENRSTKNVNNLIEILLGNIPVKSLTLDNDLSFQKHEELSELIKATIFFVTLIVLNRKEQWRTEIKQFADTCRRNATCLNIQGNIFKKFREN